MKVGENLQFIHIDSCKRVNPGIVASNFTGNDLCRISHANNSAAENVQKGLQDFVQLCTGIVTYNAALKLPAALIWT